MTAAYDAGRATGRQWPGDVAVISVASSAVLAVWSQTLAVPLLATTVLAVALLSRRARSWRSNVAPAAMLCVVIATAGLAVSTRAWAHARPRHLGAFTGWATVVGDPAPYGRALRVTLEVDGERFDAWTYGSVRRRLLDRQSGDQLQLEGTRAPSTTHPRRAQVRHVVGRFDVTVVGDVWTGSPLQRASARVRRSLRNGAESTMPMADAALFAGLVIGDDGRESAAMIDSFRASGLSHLTAVSGQNLSFLLAAASPLLRRLRPWARWAATVGLIAWFMALTRFEPSVLRAGAMAMIAASGFVLGRAQRPIRLLALAVTALVLIDPLLVWSVGFWLSVGATAGVCVVGPWLTERLPGPPWWTATLGVTLGAQVGVGAPSLLVFGRLPLVSVPANLVAVPVAGLVMLVGSRLGWRRHCSRAPCPSS